jgi:phospholipid/cholesterol/gamma-HCH transport system ATP-binding protein
VSEPAIVVDRITKSFGSSRVLDGISLTVKAGETVAVLGRSGTGKSVLLKTIIALLDPDQGEVRVFGTNLHSLSEHARLKARHGIGYVFQGAALFDSLTVMENVGFQLYQNRIPADEIRRQVLDRLTMVGLEETIDKVPSELSGGMQKRVGLARAIVGEPRLILYDEPTTGLDPLTTDVINRIILRLRRKLGVTSVVVTHDMRTAFTVADRIIMLDQGRIVAEGTPEQVERSENAWVQQFISGRISDADPSVTHKSMSSVLPAAMVAPPRPDRDNDL